MVPPRTFPLWIIFDGGQKTWEAKDLGGKRLGGKRPGGKRTGGQKTGGQKTRGQKTGGQMTGGQKTWGQKSCHRIFHQPCIWNYSYILVDMITMKYHYIGFFFIDFIKQKCVS